MGALVEFALASFILIMLVGLTLGEIAGIALILYYIFKIFKEFKK